MSEAKKAGKTVLKAVDGRKAAGVCQYSISSKGAEVTVSAQLFDSAAEPFAVLQFGPERDYQCRPPESLAETHRCAVAGLAAVWVLDGGKPALFGRLGTDAFDVAEARKRLPGSDAKPVGIPPAPAAVSIKSVPATASAALETPPPMPSFREPDISRPAAPFQPPESVLMLQPGPGPAPESPAAAARPEPLVVRRAPQPTPRPPVYSPLWDDVSAEFEKMLASLPPAQPFNGNAENARFAQMPLAGAVQCYVGSVEVRGMKVFLQAVPARPFARPAGFDHSLVSRDGESYWVKYFIQES